MQDSTTNTCIIYCRVSSSDQLDGTSLDSQERLCREYAARENLQVQAVFVERGESAKTANRTELNNALAYCKRQRIGYFIIYKVDRFARWQEDHHTVKALLQRSGTNLRSATEPIGDTPEGRFVEGVLSASAQYDNEVRAVRCKQGMLERVRRGVWVWPAPLGYTRPAQGSNIIPDPLLAPFIRLVFERYATGTYTFQRLASYMAQRGFRTRSGRKPDGQLIRQIISNPLYKGVMAVWGQRFEGSFSPLVSQELFAACQTPRQRRDGTAPRSLNNPEFPLRGFVRCSECLRTFTGSRPRNRTGEHYPYYHHYFRECGLTRFIPKADLETQFIQYLDSLAFTPDRAKLFREIVLEVAAEGRAAAEQQNATIRRQVADLEGERQRVFDLHRSGIYTDADFVYQRQLLDERIQQKTLLLKEETGSDAELRELLDSAQRILVDPAGVWKQLKRDYAARIQFQRQIIPNGIAFDGQQLRTADAGLIYQANRELANGKNCLVDLLIGSWNQIIEDLRRLPHYGRLDN
jgi:site-specific DNA recombinase